MFGCTYVCARDGFSGVILGLLVIPLKTTRSYMMKYSDELKFIRAIFSGSDTLKIT